MQIKTSKQIAKILNSDKGATIQDFSDIRQCLLLYGKIHGLTDWSISEIPHRKYCIEYDGSYFIMKMKLGEVYSILISDSSILCSIQWIDNIIKHNH